MSKILTVKGGAAMFVTLALTVALAIWSLGAYQPVAADEHPTATRSFSDTTVTPGATVTVTIATMNAGFLAGVVEQLPSGFTYLRSSLPDDNVNTSNPSAPVFSLFDAPTTFTYVVIAPSTAHPTAQRYTFTGSLQTSNDRADDVAVGGATTVTVSDVPTPTPTMPVPGRASLNTYNAGADVRVTIEAYAGSAILGGRDIEVTLEDFGISSTIDDNDVILDGSDGSYYGNPADVSVSGDTITITLPTRVSGTGGSVERAEISGAYSIFFKNSAGLSNPTSAGDKEITVSDSDTDDETSTVTIVQAASVKPTFVTRGGDATVTAKGLRDGTTTVYLMDGNKRGAALGTGTADDGEVEIEIDTSGKALVADATADGDDDVGVNTLRVIDSNDDPVGDDFMLGIKPTVELTSATAKRSTELEISVSDWYYGDIDMVTIAGISVGDVDEDVDRDGKAKFKVTVPGNVRTGDQEVKVFGDDDDLNTTSATAEVNIVVLPLDVSPSTVVPGHRVTITGTGFAKNEDVDSISIGGVPIDVPDDADSTSSGRVAVTVTVPLDVGDGDKAVKLTVDSRTGEGEIEVPEPSVELNPAESVPGSVISVRGTGFAADGRVEVKFGPPGTVLQIEEVGKADGSGNVHIRLEIPSGAGVGTTNEVEVEVRSDDPDVDISAKAEHKTPGPALTVPAEAQVGSLATISGSNFEPFTALTVMIGGKDATPTVAETDKNGSFELEARVPRLSAGSHTITIEDGSTDENSVTETFEVVTTAIVSAPAEAFADLIADGILVVVWHYDNGSGTWASYAPDSPAEVNDLTGVSSEDIVWVQTTADYNFQGASYLAGWNLYALE